MQRSAASTVTELQESLSSLSPDEKRELVQRVIDSQAFRRAPAMRAFLLYITNHAISGRGEKLKEQTIGTEVLGRAPNYDPAVDNIVRVRAHELRERLDKYFTSEGSGEPVVVAVPRGAYAPEFVPRKTVAPDTLLTAQIAGAAPLTAADEARKVGRYSLLFAAILWVAVSASIALTRYVMRSDSRAGLIRPSAAVRDFWGQFFDKPNEELKVVYADSSFALWQRLYGQTLNLGGYLSHKYLNSPDDRLLEVAAQRATSPADVAISVHLAALTGEFGGKLNLQFARDANAEFLQHDNVLLIGSHRSNPWIEVYEPSLNFELEQDGHSGSPLFRNRSPQSHEASTYAIPAMLGVRGAEEKQFIKGAEETEFLSYGVVALLKGCDDRGLTVIVEGLNMQATQAAGDFVTDPQRLDTLLQSIGHKPGTNVAPFEVLIQMTSLPGGYDSPKVIAFRLRPVPSCVGD